MKVSMESGKTLELLANICGSRRVFAEIFAQATGLRSGYQTLTNAIRANKGMSPKQMEKFLHNLHHAEGDNNLADYKDDLRYMYYLLDYLIEAGIIDRDESMRIDAMSPTEERQIERRFGDGYNPKGNGNVEGLSDDEEKEEEAVDVQNEDTERIADADTTSVGESEEKVVDEKAQEEEVDVDDVLSQLLSFSKTDSTPEEVIEENKVSVEEHKEEIPSSKGDDFLTNFLGKPTEVHLPRSVSSDGFDNDLRDVPDVFDYESKKF